MIESVLSYWRTGGPLMPILAIVSFTIWYYFFRVRGDVMDVVGVQDDFEDRLLDDLGNRSLEENLAHYQSLSGAIPQAVATSLSAAAADERPGVAFDRCRQAYRGRVDREIRVLSAFTVAAPLLGLLGTVIGMVTTFRAVSTQFGNTAVAVSEGISQALITTQCGLIVALPGIFGVARARRLLEQAGSRWGECRIHVVRMLHGVSSSGASA
jgi:biopolymer transport protein ExbB